MEAFSAEHMRLLARTRDELPGRSRSLDRWFDVAYPELKRWTRSSRRLSGEPRDQRDEFFCECVLHLHRKIVEGKFAGEIEHPRRFFRTSWERMLVDRLRERKRGREAERQLLDEAGTNRIEEFADPRSREGGASDPANLEELRGRTALADAVLGTWRTWPVPAISRFVCALEAIPDDIERSDVAEATAASKTTVRTGKDGTRQIRYEGLTRSCDDTCALLGPWIADWSRLRAGGTLAPPPELIRRLAFLLRGPPEAMDPSSWSELDEKAALDWLYQQRARTRKRLEQRLGPLLSEGET